MEHGQLLPSVWNPDHSYPQNGISTPNLGMEYGHGICTLPTPVKEYRLLLIASIELRTNPNPSICAQVSLELFDHTDSYAMYMSMLSVLLQDRREEEPKLWEAVTVNMVIDW